MPKCLPVFERKSYLTFQSSNKRKHLSVEIIRRPLITREWDLNWKIYHSQSEYHCTANQFGFQQQWTATLINTTYFLKKVKAQWKKLYCIKNSYSASGSFTGSECWPWVCQKHWFLLFKLRCRYFPFRFGKTFFFMFWNNLQIWR